MHRTVTALIMMLLLAGSKAFSAEKSPDHAAYKKYPEGSPVGRIRKTRSGLISHDFFTAFIPGYLAGSALFSIAFHKVSKRSDTLSVEGFQYLMTGTATGIAGGIISGSLAGFVWKHYKKACAGKI